jgi:hypothetical protein
MYATYIVKRTQIYLDDAQDNLLVKRARSEGKTKSLIIREAVDQYLARPLSDDDRLMRFRAAVTQFAGIAPYLPPGKDYVEKLRGAEAGRQEELERRRRG